MKGKAFILTLCFILFCLVDSTTPEASSSFTVYDCTHYFYPSQPPNLEELGFKKHIILTQGVLLGGSPTEPSESIVRQAARNAGHPADNLISLDIESWPWDSTASDATVRETVRKLSLVADWVKDERPDLRVGFYSIPPIRDYWRAISDEGSSSYQQWQQDNDRLSALCGHVDAIFPSLYTFYDDQEGWVKYAKANITEAKRVCPGKPVYPYIWYMYHPSNPQAGSEIPESYFRLQLQTVLESGADGVVIWGERYDGVSWSEDMPWWMATKDFLKSLESMITITTSSLPDGTVNKYYTFTLNTANGIPPYTWAITQGHLPTGINLDISTGEISGMPSQEEAQTFTVQVMDANNDTASKQLTLTISAPSQPDYKALNSTGIVIDGNLSDFDQAQPLSFQDNGRGSQDNAAIARIMWDSEYLYLGLELTDTELNAVALQDDDTNLWQDDCIEIFIDPDNSGGSDMGSEDYRYDINLHEKVLDGYGFNNGWAWDGSSIKKVTLEGTLNDNSDIDIGYTIETAIPWSAVGITVTESQLIGLQIGITDKDDEASGYQYFGWPIDINFDDPDSWAKVILGGSTLYEKEDINQDGIVDVLDSQLCVNVFSGVETTPSVVERADVNDDDVVNVIDIQQVINRILYWGMR